MKWIKEVNLNGDQLQRDEIVYKRMTRPMQWNGNKSTQAFDRQPTPRWASQECHTCSLVNLSTGIRWGRRAWCNTGSTLNNNKKKVVLVFRVSTRPNGRAYQSARTVLRPWVSGCLYMIKEKKKKSFNSTKAIRYSPCYFLHPYSWPLNYRLQRNQANLASVYLRV